mmetsp:Transcript_99226/g.280980  ORF Transcript_99226/g.280980 Transcript_99226/m.280980 type:complete len:273 (+) Transcript_99226:501-1319(+)
MWCGVPVHGEDQAVPRRALHHPEGPGLFRLLHWPVRPPRPGPGWVHDLDDVPPHPLAQVLHQLQPLHLRPGPQALPADQHGNGGPGLAARGLGDSAQHHIALPARPRAGAPHRPLELRAPLPLPAPEPALGTRPPGRRRQVPRQVHAHRPHDACGQRRGRLRGAARGLELRRGAHLPRHALVQQPVPLPHRLGRGVRLQRHALAAGQALWRRAPHVARHWQDSHDRGPRGLHGQWHDRRLLRLLAPCLCPRNALQCVDGPVREIARGGQRDC